MKSFHCPYCSQLIIASQVPTTVLASAAGQVKSTAKANAARLNAKRPRKPVATGPGLPADPVKPEPEALVAETAPVGGGYAPGLRKAGEARKEPVMGADTPCAEAGVRPVTLAEAQKLATKLKPLHTEKKRDYSGAYS